MKKLVNTVVGAALAASMIAGCSSNEPATTAAPEETTKDTAMETTVPVETTEAAGETTAPVEETTVPVEETTEAAEETTSFTTPEIIVTPTTQPTEEETWETDYCPNATDWA